MNIYLFEITSGDKWEMSEGVYIVSALTKNKAIKIVKNEIRAGGIISVELLKSTKQEVLFKKAPTIE